MAPEVGVKQQNGVLPGSGVVSATFREVYEQELGEALVRRGHAAADPRSNLNGLAFSGGGIRSATFCLGVLQKFNELGLLTRFDYLSTVSGGGFIGGWWSAWLSRRQSTRVFPPAEKIEPEREDSYRGQAATRLTDSAISAGVDPIHHVRLFSNYLTPRKGALSLDTWRVITVGLRNLLATWLILLPVMVAVMLIAQLYFVHFQPPFFRAPHGTIEASTISRRIHLLLAPLIFLGGLFATTSFAWVINTWDTGQRGTWYVRLLSSSSGFFAGALVAGLAVYETFAADPWLLSKRGLAILTGRCPISGADLMDPFSKQLPSLLALLWLGLAITVLLWCYGLPIALSRTPEELGTRLTQASQTFLAAFVAVGAVLAFFGFVQELWIYVATQEHGVVARSGGWIAVFGSLASIAFTLWKELPTGGGELHADGKLSTAGRAISTIAPPAALAILGLLLAELVDLSFNHLSTAPNSVTYALALYRSAVFFVLISLLCLFRESVIPLKRPERLHLILGLVYGLLLGGLMYLPAEVAKSPGSFREFLPFMGISLALGWVGTFGWYVDPNALSLHGFYKARLTRAYLGASNPDRFFAGSQVTEAVSGDDVLLSDLKNCDFGAPYHLINATLNLVGGNDLATAQRLAEPFLMSKLYCGTVGGYRPTKCYMNNRLTLGTAVAVSGAAVSPNMGSMTLGSALAMLLTIFNIRLGYWAPTPNQSSWLSPQARHWPWYTLREFMSQTTDQGKYCNLSDGGHFDNTGVYSLIQRGCRLIVMIDCGADRKTSFEDLGNLIRRCRIDFGAEIDVDISRLTDNAWPVTRCLRGTIAYSEKHLGTLGRSPENSLGTLILIKPSLTVEEAIGKRLGGSPEASADIRQFRIANSDYPQVSTADQWFTEAQFESYRQLGELSAETVHSSFLKDLLI